MKSNSGTLLVTLGARLINDDEPECRKKIAECISAMLKKLPKADRDPLYDIIVTWLKDKNVCNIYQKIFLFKTIIFYCFRLITEDLLHKYVAY